MIRVKCSRWRRKSRSHFTSFTTCSPHQSTAYQDIRTLHASTNSSAFFVQGLALRPDGLAKITAFFLTARLLGYDLWKQLGS